MAPRTAIALGIAHRLRPVCLGPCVSNASWRCRVRSMLLRSGKGRTMRAVAAIALAMVAASVAPAPLVAASGTHVLAPRSYKPTRNWCPTNRTCFSHVAWTRYNGSEAFGVGSAQSCAGGGGHCSLHVGLGVTLTAPRWVCGALRFTRLRMFGRTFGLGDCSTYM